MGGGEHLHKTKVKLNETTHGKPQSGDSLHASHGCPTDPWGACRQDCPWPAVTPAPAAGHSHQQRAAGLRHAHGEAPRAPARSDCRFLVCLCTRPGTGRLSQHRPAIPGSQAVPKCRQGGENTHSCSAAPSSASDVAHGSTGCPAVGSQDGRRHSFGEKGHTLVLYLVLESEAPVPLGGGLRWSPPQDPQLRRQGERETGAPHRLQHPLHCERPPTPL